MTYSKNVKKCESLVNSKKYLLIFPNQILLYLQCVQNEYIWYAMTFNMWMLFKIDCKTNKMSH